jgi:small-conductance mechanosensitive channel/CRP-like cAMP-binding protein
LIDPPGRSFLIGDFDTNAMDHREPRNQTTRILKSIAIPAVGLGLVALLDNRIRGGHVQLDHAGKLVAIGYILLGLALAYRLICDVALDIALARASARRVPRILRHLIGIAMVLLAALMVTNVLYPGALTSLLTLSSVIAVVVGLALRPIILDVFSGVSANLDSAFHIGDWIQINGRNDGKSHTGWVEQINWRTTQLRTRSGNLIVCPNSTLSTAVIINYSRPSRLSRFDIKVKLPPELDSDRARQILLAAVGAATGGDRAASKEQAPDVLVTAMEASGIEYWIRFWLDPSQDSIDAAVDEVSRCVLRHLQLAGIPLSEKVVLHRGRRPLLDIRSTRGRAEVLSRAALFNGISQGTLEILAGNALLDRFERGDTLIRQGDADSDMFLLVEGAVQVSVDKNGAEVMVARMRAGDYFGELSLLTGEPRNATIRAVTAGAAYRISREAISPVIEHDPGLMGLLSRNLAERNLSREAKTAQEPGENPAHRSEGLASVLLSRMMSIFRGCR